MEGSQLVSLFLKGKMKMNKEKNKNMRFHQVSPEETEKNIWIAATQFITDLNIEYRKYLRESDSEIENEFPFTIQDDWLESITSVEEITLKNAVLEFKDPFSNESIVIKEIEDSSSLFQTVLTKQDRRVQVIEDNYLTSEAKPTIDNSESEIQMTMD